jgi:hypothetical protein
MHKMGNATRFAQLSTHHSSSCLIAGVVIGPHELYPSTNPCRGGGSSGLRGAEATNVYCV